MSCTGAGAEFLVAFRCVSLRFLLGLVMACSAARFLAEILSVHAYNMLSSALEMTTTTQDVYMSHHEGAPCSTWHTQHDVFFQPHTLTLRLPASPRSRAREPALLKKASYRSGAN